MRLRPWAVILSSLWLLFQVFCNTRNPDTPDFARDIAPIIHRNCSPCHHPNGAAPFSLITYEDVWDKGRTIAEVTALRYMPPWPADPGYSHFKNERYLSDEEIALIRQWVDLGKPAGDTAGLLYPKLQYYSLLGKPDKVLKLPKMAIRGDAKDRFWVVKVPGLLESDTYIRAIEFIPDQKAYVHHVNGFMLNYRLAPAPGKRDSVNIESESYDEEFKELGLIDKEQPVPRRIHSAFNYLPGVFAAEYPE